MTSSEEYKNSVADYNSNNGVFTRNLTVSELHYFESFSNLDNDFLNLQTCNGIDVAAPYAHPASRGVSTNSDVVVIHKIIKTLIPELEITT